MLEKVKEAFEKFNFLSPKDVIQIASICKIATVKKNEQILLAGSINFNIYAVIKGLLRHYTLDENGVDKTLRFANEKHIAGSLESLFNGEPATENIEALENTIVLKIDLRKFEKLAANNVRLLKAQNKQLKELIVENVQHIKYLNLLSPEDRYLAFRKEFPKLESRVKQKYLASYLGVTPTSFSRLKSRIE